MLAGLTLLMLALALLPTKAFRPAFSGTPFHLSDASRKYVMNLCYIHRHSWEIDPLGSVCGSTPWPTVGSIASSLLARLTRYGFSFLTAKRNNRGNPEFVREGLIMDILNVLVDVVMGIALDAGTGVVVGFLTGRSHN